MLGANGMREKNVFYEESAHIPLLIKSPGVIQPGTTVEGYTSLIDLFPTILDYLEVPEIESDRNAELRFWYYVSDVSQFESTNQVEIG